MIKFLAFLTFVLFLQSGSIFCQIVKEKIFKFSGIVLDQDSLNSVKNVQIQINNEKFVISKENGQFFFSAKPKDTILIFKDGMKASGMIVPDTLISDKILIGIFMARDSVKANNIILYPKIDETDLRSAMLKSTPKETQEQNAGNNLKIASYQAQSNKNTEWDASMNQKNAIKQYETGIEYKYMIPPDKMLMFTGIKPYVKKIIKESQIEKAEIEMNKKEENILKELFLKNKRK